MRADDLERLHERALTIAVTALALAERVANLVDELEALADAQYADEQGPPVLVLRKGEQ